MIRLIPGNSQSGGHGVSSTKPSGGIGNGVWISQGSTFLSTEDGGIPPGIQLRKRPTRRAGYFLGKASHSIKFAYLPPTPRPAFSRLIVTMDSYMSGADPVTSQPSSQIPENELQDPVRQNQHNKKSHHSQSARNTARKPSQPRSSRGATGGGPPVAQEGQHSEGGSKRKRASLACNTCRLRKSKVSLLGSRALATTGSPKTQIRLLLCWPLTTFCSAMRGAPNACYVQILTLNVSTNTPSPPIVRSLAKSKYRFRFESQSANW